MKNSAPKLVSEKSGPAFINGLPVDNEVRGASYRFVVEEEGGGQRLDLFLSRHISEITRSALGHLIHAGLVVVNGRNRKAGYRVKTNDDINVRVPESAPATIIPERVFFEIIHEDDDLLVISKPPDVVVHPACGHQTGTLVHGLLFHCHNLSGISGEQRPGIVHRLDKDTSGVMVVTKNDRAHKMLVDQFKERKIEKVYLALLEGRLQAGEGRIALPIGRHPVKRKKMAVEGRGSRDAATSWKVVEEFPGVTYVELRPSTGRTHQLRVHMAFKGHPVLGDDLYGGKKRGPGALKIKRQCLHAYRLSFDHPNTGKRLTFTAPLWPDMEEILAQLRDGKEF